MKKFLLALGLLSAIANAQDGQDYSTLPDLDTGDFEPVLESDVPELDNEGLDGEEEEYRKFVGVPKGYVYNTKLGNRHDFCTASPDSYLKADFRGPCARHDMCYDSRTDKKKCDVVFRKDLGSNCDHAYGKFNPLRYTCHEMANKYFVAVVAVW